MSKHKESKPAPLADWQVTDTSGGYGSPQTELIRQARWKRDSADWITFRDEQDVVAAYAPGAVLSIIRKEPPVVVHPPGFEDETRQSGFERTGPPILPVAPHGGK